MNTKEIREYCQRLFSDRAQYMTLLQEIAENFYPQRADFTVRRDVGDEFADNLMTSYPTLARRDLSDQLGVMLRPTDREWFKIVPEHEENEDLGSSKWLEWATKVQRRAMYDPMAKLARATKEGDNDFSTFGQAVISIRPNKFKSGLLYRCWHLRDVAWSENEEGDIGFIVRKWKPTYRDLVRMFPGRCHENIENKVSKHPFEEAECYHIICESDLYDKPAGDKPYFSIYLDVVNDHVMEEIPVFNQEYIIPRWQTVAGSQYAYSPAAICALPDARLIQSMTYTLLEAGEKAVNPPLIATQDAVKSDAAIYAGGITWVSEEYDEKMGAALRPISQDNRSIPLGFEMAEDIRSTIHQSFYLNKLTLPQRAPEMTAYEVGQRIQEYIRGAIPIFEPMEAEYNGALCERSFDLLMKMGAFGSPLDMPPSLSGADVRFKFESPLHDAIEAQKGQKFTEAGELLAQAAQLDPSAPATLNPTEALRDVLSGIGVPAKWIHSEDEVKEILRKQQEAQQVNQLLEQGNQVADITQKVANAG